MLFAWNAILEKPNEYFRQMQTLLIQSKSRVRGFCSVLAVFFSLIVPMVLYNYPIVPDSIDKITNIDNNIRGDMSFLARKVSLSLWTEFVRLSLLSLLSL